MKVKQLVLLHVYWFMPPLAPNPFEVKQLVLLLIVKVKVSEGKIVTFTLPN